MFLINYKLVVLTTVYRRSTYIAEIRSLSDRPPNAIDIAKIVDAKSDITLHR